MTNVIVTGGCGFIGSHLCDYLINKGHNVLCIDDLSTGYMKNIEHLIENKKFKMMCKNVQKHEDIEKSLQEYNFAPDCIYHLACPASPKQYQKNSLNTLLTNIHGTETMLKIATKYKSKFLLASTSEIYGDPETSPQKETYWGNVNNLGIRSCYDEGKRIAETLAYEYNKTYNTEIRIARIFNTYGPKLDILNDGRAVCNFIKQALGGEDITIYGDGKQTRSFCYVDDTVTGLISLMNSDKYNGPINIGNPDEMTIDELANKIVFLTKSKSKFVYMASLEDDPKQRKPDITKAKKFLNWNPIIEINDGLKKTLDSYNRNNKNITFNSTSPTDIKLDPITTLPVNIAQISKEWSIIIAIKNRTNIFVDYEPIPLKILQNHTLEPSGLKHEIKLTTDNKIILDLLINYLKSLEDIKLPDEIFEIVIVDFKSEDYDMENLKYKFNNLTIKIVESDSNFSRGKGLNIGYNNSTKNNIFFCDADMFLSTRELFDNAYKYLEQNKIYFPICLSLCEPSHQMGYWRKTGYGMCMISKDLYESNKYNWDEYDTLGKEDDNIWAFYNDKNMCTRDKVHGYFHQWHPETKEFKNKFYKNSDLKKPKLFINVLENSLTKEEINKILKITKMNEDSYVTYKLENLISTIVTFENITVHSQKEISEYVKKNKNVQQYIFVNSEENIKKYDLVKSKNVIIKVKPF